MSSSDLSRVNLVVNIRFPGPRAHGIQVAAMAEALAATGLNVDVVVPRRFPYRDVDTYGHYGVRHTFGVQRLASFDTIDLFPPRWQRMPFLLQTATFAWRALARTAVERDAGIVVRDHYTLAILMNGLRSADRERLAAEVHSLPAPGPRREQALAMLARVPALIVISEALRDDLVASGIDRERILVARDGVHLSRFAGLPDAVTARRHLHLPEKPTLVYAGQFYPWKGVDTLIEAMARLPDAQLLVVGGDAHNLPRVVGLAQHVAPGRVHFAGTVPHASVPFHLAGGDIVVLPNSGKEEISARFTSPLKLFEAMASNRPIVASDIPSLREVLAHDRDAVLVAPDDPAALAAGIATLLADPARGRRLAAAARQEVGAYDWSARGHAVAAFLRQRLTVRGSR